MQPRVLLLQAPGTNRDGDAAHAISLAGGDPIALPLTELQTHRAEFAKADVLLLPGGFSYGDALGAGRRWALDLELFFHDELHSFIAAGKRVLGICNGFQVLVKAGLLPGWGEEAAARTVTLTHNANGHFECRWVYLTVNRDCKADYLQAMPAPIFCPIAHGEGNLQLRDDATLARLENEGLIAFHYSSATGTPANGEYPLNPGGSVGDIAGLCNPAGNVLGLMPHPENHILPIQNPLRGNQGLGLELFKAVINTGLTR